MSSQTKLTTTKGGQTGYLYATASQTQPQPQSTQGQAGSYHSYTGPSTSQPQNASTQGYPANYTGNQAYYPDSQYDPTFDHIGSWAQGIPYDMYSRDTQNGRISWEQFQPPAPNAERRKKKNTGAPQTSYQMDRYLSQQPKQDPWSILSREQRNK